MRAFVSRYPVLLFVLLTLSYQFVVVGVVWAKLAPGTHISNDEVAHMIFRFRVFGPLVFAVMITAYLEGMAGMRKLFGAFFHWKVSAISGSRPLRSLEFARGPDSWWMIFSVALGRT